ncbi:MAG: hypothetical protein MUP90_04815 [Gammaproteobacteria bacterium]|nr:hypothetical protein [Gammaproteobacteria bacterium]
MNARKILNSTLSAVLFTGFLAATLPALNNPDMSPMQAYVWTPVLMMLAGLGGLALYQGLDWAHARLNKSLYKPSDHLIHEEKGVPGKCFAARRSEARAAREAKNAGHNTGLGRRAA